MNPIPRNSLLTAVTAAVLVGCMGTAKSAEDLLPDVTIDPDATLFDYDLITDGTTVVFRFTSSTPNIGAGPLHCVGVTPANGDGTQSVNQVISLDDGSTREREAGRFIYHEGHDHFHLEGWAVYRLYEDLGGEPGPDQDPIRESDKTSFCLVDSVVYDDTLPNIVIDEDPESRTFGEPVRAYYECDRLVQGISVGWSDVYSKRLVGQRLDVTGLPPGDYWLETLVDPDDHILESDETNNQVFTRVTLDTPVIVDGPIDGELPDDDLREYHDHMDVRVGKRRCPCTHIGDNVYSNLERVQMHNRGKIQQLLSLRGKNSKQISFHSSVENESSFDKTFRVRCNGRSNRLVKMSHFDTSKPFARNVTAAMKGKGLAVGVDSDSMATFMSRSKQTRRGQQADRDGKKIRNLFYLKAWEGEKTDKVWVYLRYF